MGQSSPETLCLPYNHLAGDARVLCPQDGVRRLGRGRATPPGAGDGVVVAVCSLSWKGQTSLDAFVRGPGHCRSWRLRGPSRCPSSAGWAPRPAGPGCVRGAPTPAAPAAPSFSFCSRGPGPWAAVLLLGLPCSRGHQHPLLPGALLKEAPKAQQSPGHRLRGRGTWTRPPSSGPPSRRPSSGWS